MRPSAAAFRNKLAAPAAVASNATNPHARATPTGVRWRGTRFVGSPGRFSLAPVFILWVLLLFNPQWFLVAKGIPSLVLKLPVAIFGILILVLLFHAPRVKHWYAPLMVYTAFLVVYYPFAYNPFRALPSAKQAILAYVLTLATLTLVQRPKHVKNVLLIVLLFRYLWYGAHGVMTDGVAWDPWFANYDALGALMAMGLVSSLHVALAATSSRLRWLAMGTSLLCVTGLVSSFARGAVLAAGFGIAFGWIRSGRRRLAYAGWGVAMLVTLVIAAGVVAGVSGRGDTRSDFARDSSLARGTFWGEMATIAGDVFDAGAVRRVLWRTARKEFIDNPLAGVGPGSFGAYAAQNYSGSVLGDQYEVNPSRFYQRAVHNVFLQVLAEQGLIGSILFLSLLIDFWRRNTAVRRSASESDTRLLRGLRTRPLALGLEASMVAFLAASMFYNMLNGIQFYLLLAANVLLHVTWMRSHRNSTTLAPTQKWASASDP